MKIFKSILIVLTLLFSLNQVQGSVKTRVQISSHDKGTCELLLSCIETLANGIKNQTTDEDLLREIKEELNQAFNENYKLFDKKTINEAFGMLIDSDKKINFDNNNFANNKMKGKLHIPSFKNIEILNLILIFLQHDNIRKKLSKNNVNHLLIRSVSGMKYRRKTFLNKIRQIHNEVLENEDCRKKILGKTLDLCFQRDSIYAYKLSRKICKYPNLKKKLYTNSKTTKFFEKALDRIRNPKNKAGFILFVNLKNEGSKLGEKIRTYVARKAKASWEWEEENFYSYY